MTIIEFDEECSSCNGTGIYLGMAERDGYGVICYKCQGTGKRKHKHEFHEFTGRKLIANVRHVVECNPGIVLGGSFDFGGMPYEDWIHGKNFEDGMEMRKFTCPSWWFQTADNNKRPNWNKCEWGVRFPECKYFHEKEKCWEEYDAENK